MRLLRSLPRRQPQISNSTAHAGSSVSTPSGSLPSSSQRFLRRHIGGKAKNDTKAVVWDILHMVLTTATEVETPIPYLKIGLLALVEVIKKIQAMQTVVEGIATLKERVTSLVESIRRFVERHPGPQLPEEVQARVDELVGLWQGIAERAENIKSRGRIMRFITSSRDAKKLGDLVEEINDSIQDKVLMSGILNIEVGVHEIRSGVKAIKALLQPTFIPKHAKKARFDANEVRRSCLEGTRMGFLTRIYTWVTVACEHVNAVPEGGIVMWINGLGGTGKTTIAHSVAVWCNRNNVLGGSFFCSRSDAECSAPDLVFLTLCRQLCIHHRPYKDKVEEALEHDPDIVNAGPTRQFEELIVRPLEALESPFPRSVFVLDALDELKDEGAKSTILSVIARFIARIAKFLLFIITSRPEQRIQALFDASGGVSLGDTTTPLHMHEIPLDEAHNDIRLYLDHEFKEHIGILSIEPGWPSNEEKDALAIQSQGLFIYAATAVRFIIDETYRDPRGQVKLLLSTSQGLPMPHDFLFTLYSRILVASYGKASSELKSRLWGILGTLVSAQEPLSPSSIAHLVGLRAADVRNTLTGLHSVLHVPASNDQPIRIIHPTFIEFLLQSPKTTSPAPPNLSAPPYPLSSMQHWTLFSRCIVAMTGNLKRDMIALQYPAKFQSEVTDLRERVNTAIQPHVSYACRFWSVHFCDGIAAAASLDVSVTFGDFVRKKLLYWLEACSLLNAMDRVVSVLYSVRIACQRLGGQFGDLAPLLADCRRFALAFSPCIHAAPLQIYHCALSIAPTNSLVGNTYVHERTHALVVDHGSSSNWAPRIDAFPGHGSKTGNMHVNGVAFPSVGSWFVTTGRDNKAAVWDTATRTLIMSFDGHTSDVNCVACAPDGLHVASGADDGRVCVWQASSGECVHTLEGHTDDVYSVAYSGDGRRIVSATEEGEVKLWDTTDGRCLLTLDNTGNQTMQVGISTDGNVIACGDGASLCLYDVSSSTSKTLKFPDTVEACTFSPDGRYVAARSEGAIRLWKCTGKSRILTIKTPYLLTSRLAFSRDGKVIGCGSEYGSVFLWHTASSGSPRTLRGHTQQIHDLAYSPDGSQMVSIADSGMTRVWDLTSSSVTAEEPATLEPPPSPPKFPRFAIVQIRDRFVTLLDLQALRIDAKCFSIMPAGAPTAMLFSDVTGVWSVALQATKVLHGTGTAEEWALLTGRQRYMLSERPFAVSLDSSLMAYPSPVSNNMISICEIHTGTEVTTLTGHIRAVNSVAFSADNARVATTSRDHSIKVWDTQTGALVCTHTEHRAWTRAVAFSPDGRLVASGSDDSTVRILEVATKRIVHVLKSHRAYIMHVMFAADNIHLVALDRDHWVYVWDITNEECIHESPLEGDAHWINSPIFSPDDSGILIGSDTAVSRTVGLWNPGTRTWPIYHIEGGWVYAMSPGKTRRLCWLPPEWRTALHSDGTMFYVGEDTSGPPEKRKVIALNMSDILGYIDALDAQYFQPPPPL